MECIKMKKVGIVMLIMGHSLLQSMIVDPIELDNCSSFIGCFAGYNEQFKKEEVFHVLNDKTPDTWHENVHFDSEGNILKKGVCIPVGKGNIKLHLSVSCDKVNDPVFFLYGVFDGNSFLFSNADFFFEVLLKFLELHFVFDTFGKIVKFDTTSNQLVNCMDSVISEQSQG